jgi:hypothetical protein
MRLMPESNAEKITFCQSHLAAWAEHAEAIGASPEEVAALAAKVEAARAARLAKGVAEQAAQSATLAMNMAIEEMATAAATIVAKVRTRARQDGDAVYSLANIPAPEKGSPIAPPGGPERFNVELNQIGAVTLMWKCKNPRGAVGTTYLVRRRIGRGGAFEYVGTVGECRFDDWTIPAGATDVEYEVQGIRSTAKGPAVRHTVHFGGIHPAFAAMASQQRAA